MQHTYSVIRRPRRLSEPQFKFEIAFDHFLCLFPWGLQGRPTRDVSLEWGQPSEPAANKKIKNYAYDLI